MAAMTWRCRFVTFMRRDGLLPGVAEGIAEGDHYRGQSLWRAEEPPANLATLHETVKTAVTGVKGKFIDIGQPLQGKPELVVEDKVHPNDAGAKAIADATYAALTKTPATRSLIQD